MLEAYYKQYRLHFKKPGGTSRGILHTKDTYFIIIKDQEKWGIGECALFRGLSADDVPDYEDKLAWVCRNISLGKEALLAQLDSYPSIIFGLEQAFLSYKGATPFELFPSKFTEGLASIPINGLIWMGTPEFMQAQIAEKLNSGFTTIKLKIGAIDFKTELALLQKIRNQFSADEIELRVDANGAFSPDTALEKLKRLSDLDIHSIEQPIKANQWKAMKKLCEQTPLPIALDEELIGVFDNKEVLLDYIKPQYIILKPSLTGGIVGTNQWIKYAEKRNIGWWITSALESNIGLNAIAQYTYQFDVTMPQGLGTGGLFSNNFNSPLTVIKGRLQYINPSRWNNFKLF